MAANENGWQETVTVKPREDGVDDWARELLVDCVRALRDILVPHLRGRPNGVRRESERVRETAEESCLRVENLYYCKVI